MLELFDKPKIVTVKEINNAKDFKYVERFEYGDDNNWVDAVVDLMYVDYKYSRRIPEGNPYFKKDSWSICRCTEFRYLIDCKRNGYEDAIPDHAYSSNEHIDSLKEFDNIKVEVIGIWKLN